MAVAEFSSSGSSGLISTETLFLSTNEAPLTEKLEKESTHLCTFQHHQQGNDTFSRGQGGVCRICVINDICICYSM